MGRRGSYARQAGFAIAVVILPVLANVHLLFGFLNAAYVFLYSGLDPAMPVYSPHPTIDFNIGVLSEAQGRRVAADIFSGIMPWWNPYEGVGMPLAGNMQSAALFPPILLLGLNNGFLYLHILLQGVAGLFTYLLMRRLGATDLAAFTCGLLFEFNGTFAWLPEHPVAFLPMLLYAVELEIGQVSGAWRWIAVAVALSLYGGFPEIAYIDGLFVALWALVRLASIPTAMRIKNYLRMALGVACGVALSAPILIAFADYLSVAFLAMHGNDFLSHFHLDWHSAVGLGLPYVFGLIFRAPEVLGIYAYWGLVGGYIGVSLFMLGLLGIATRKYFGLRMALASWLTFCAAAAFGLPGARLFIEALLLGNAAFFRYYYPSFAMGFVVLAGLALDDFLAAVPKRRFYLMLLAMAALLAIGLAGARRLLAAEHNHFWLVVSIGIALSALACMGLASRLPPPQFRRVLSAILIAETLFNFLLPSFSYTRYPQLELGGIHYLQAHIGNQRVFTMGPMQPNYGSYFGIAEIDDCDLPIPANWYGFRQKYLDPYAGALLFDGQARRVFAGDVPTAAQEFKQNFAAYESVGVRYVLTRPGATLDPGLKLPNVYSDSVMDIYELPNPHPYFDAAGCTIAPNSRTTAVTHCPAPALLTRLELFMPGWTAKVNGRPAQISVANKIFQQVVLPKGQADIRFSFQPPYMRLGYALFFAGLLLLCTPMKIFHAGRRQMQPVLGSMIKRWRPDV